MLTNLNEGFLETYTAPLEGMRGLSVYTGANSTVGRHAVLQCAFLCA